jgi:hypothetical protein
MDVGRRGYRSMLVEEVREMDVGSRGYRWMLVEEVDGGRGGACW